MQKRAFQGQEKGLQGCRSRRKHCSSRHYRSRRCCWQGIKAASAECLNARSTRKWGKPRCCRPRCTSTMHALEVMFTLLGQSNNS
eukprot:scaffold268334_cov21-Tisochrysis_lutea.AAC.1